jgi:hypothetical protein
VARNFWTAGGNNLDEETSSSGAGTSTAGLNFGGSGTKTNCEEYDGSTWASGGALSTGRASGGGAGTQTAGLSFGGDTGSASDSVVTEEYNGTSWSAGGDLNTARREIGGAGTQTAGLAIGGNGPLSSTEEYNGTSWSAGGSLITAIDQLGACGTQSAALTSGGNTGSGSTTYCEEYNGTSWSSGGNLVTAQDQHAAFGTQSAGVSFGGIASLTVTQEYDGTSWSTSSNLPGGGTRLQAGFGTQSAGIKCQGVPGSDNGTWHYQNPVTVGSYKLSWATYESVGAETSFVIDANHGHAYDVLLLFINKDDDVAVDAITGWTQQLGFESNNAIYSEVWKRDADGTETTVTVTGDSEEYVATLIAIEGADYSTIANVTNALGTNAAPTSNSASVTSGDYLAFSAFGVDGDSNPYTPDVDMKTCLPSPPYLPTPAR